MTQDTISGMTDVEIRAKAFLLYVMGQKIYDKFTKDGKIEIKSGKYRYILDKDGIVINKTMMKSYCITTNFSFYPLSDIIAIKYCWIKYGNWTVERVAYKNCLNYSEIRDLENDNSLSYKIDNIIANYIIRNDIYFMTAVFVLIMSLALLIYVIIKFT